MTPHSHEFEKGTPIPDIAARHGRTERAIEARLVKLGLLREDQRMTRSSFTGEGVREDKE